MAFETVVTQNPGSFEEFCSVQPPDKATVGEFTTVLSSFRNGIAQRYGVSLDDLHYMTSEELQTRAASEKAPEASSTLL